MKITLYRYRQKNLEEFFTMEGTLVTCKDVDGLFKALNIITDRLALLAHSVRIRPSVQGLLWDEFDGLSEDKLKILFLLS